MSGVKTELLRGNQKPRAPSLLFSAGPCLGHTWEPQYCSEHSLKTTAFKVLRIFSKEGPSEWLAESQNILAEERTFVLTVSEDTPAQSK